MSRIIGLGNYRETIDTEVPDLKLLLKETLGMSVRRINRFIQLALIGAARCINSTDIKPPADTAVYLASGRGDMEITVEVQRDLFEHGHEPRPLNFINTVSNAASFYIAQSFGLQGRNQFIANRHWAFEVALQSALLDLQLGKTHSALVGAVDVAVSPIDEHRQRLGLSKNAALAEGSHWLWLDNNSLPTPTRGKIECVRHFSDEHELLTWIPSLRNEHAQLICSSGQFMASDVFSSLRKTCDLTQEFIYRSDDAGYYDSQSGGVVADFIESGGLASDIFDSHSNGATLLHLNTDSMQRYIALVARREPA